MLKLLLLVGLTTGAGAMLELGLGTLLFRLELEFKLLFDVFR